MLHPVNSALMIVLSLPPGVHWHSQSPVGGDSQSFLCSGTEHWLKVWG